MASDLPSFDVTADEIVTINNIADRAWAKYEQHGIVRDHLGIVMDLAACHAYGCPLDFDRLLAFDDGNLMHDVTGIANHIDRETGKLTGFFVPRCAKPSQPEVAA